MKKTKNNWLKLIWKTLKIMYGVAVMMASIIFIIATILGVMSGLVLFGEAQGIMPSASIIVNRYIWSTIILSWALVIYLINKFMKNKKGDDEQNGN